MSYAIRKDGKGWRAVNSPDDVMSDETYSETIPEKTKAQLKREELQSLAKVFNENTKALDIAWLAAARADGVNEDTRKAAVIAEVSALQAKYDEDVAAVRAKYA